MEGVLGLGRGEILVVRYYEMLESLFRGFYFLTFVKFKVSFRCLRVGFKVGIFVFFISGYIEIVDIVGV